MRRLIPLLALLWVAACAGATNYSSQHHLIPSEDRAALAAAPSCCASLSALPWVPLPINQTWTVVLNRQSPAFDFATGKSHFAAYRIPEDVDALEIKLEAELSTRTFHPVFLVLDAGFSTVRILDKPDFTGRAAFLGTGGTIEASLTLPEGHGARYVVLLTTRELLADATMLEDGKLPLPVPLRSGPIHEWQQRTYFYHGPYGTVVMRTDAR